MVTIIVNYNRAGDTKELIESIRKSDLINSEILIIDNGSTDKSFTELKNSFPEVATIETGNNLGFAGGYNFGMKLALQKNPEAILIINNDTLVPSVFLKPLEEALFSEITVGAVSPKTYLADGKHIWWAGGKINLLFGQITNIGADQTDAGQFNEVINCDYLSGVCILFKREVLEKVGLFDERFTHTCEDDDLSIRIRTAGYKLLMNPAATLIHKVSQTGGGEYSDFHLYSLEKYRLILMKKWGAWRGIFSLLLLLPVFARRSFSVMLRGNGLQSVIAVFSGWRDGYNEKLS